MSALTNARAALAVVGLWLAGCHDYAALSSAYGAADLGCPDCADLSASSDAGAGTGDMTSAADLASSDGAPPDLPRVGQLSGSAGATLAMVDLTSEGTFDWAHFGYPQSGDMDYKAGGPRAISYYTTLSGNSATVYTNDPCSYAWQDGTLTPSLAGTTSGMYRTGVADGFSFTVPATTTPRTLAVYVGGYRSNGKLTATLSDHSAPDYSDASFSRSDDSLYDVTYRLTFAAAAAGQTLTVTWAAASVVNDGNVSLQAATLR